MVIFTAISVTGPTSARCRKVQRKKVPAASYRWFNGVLVVQRYAERCIAATPSSVVGVFKHFFVINHDTHLLNEQNEENEMTETNDMSKIWNL